MVEYRKNRISWDSQWMLSALSIAQRSCDPSTQVGAVLVTQNNRQIASGYNNPPKGIHPSCIPWAREHDDPERTKYPYIVHAERNAVHNAVASTKHSVMYVTLFPCHECMKDIIQASIKKVVFLSDKYHDTWEAKVSRRMASLADIECVQHQWQEDIQLILDNITSQIISQ